MDWHAFAHFVSLTEPGGEWAYISVSFHSATTAWSSPLFMPTTDPLPNIVTYAPPSRN